MLRKITQICFSDPDYVMQQYIINYEYINKKRLKNNA